LKKKEVEQIIRVSRPVIQVFSALRSDFQFQEIAIPAGSADERTNQAYW
jgi:hypothetical protein